ncbi:MAG: hypothetical protein IKL84_02875 [Clostridia bacterium]|nr:hypothetical protein [Clostridia bacterium]
MKKGSIVAFLKDYSYYIVRMFIYQIAIAIFGLTLAIATGISENFMLQFWCSTFAILFYLFLICSTIWEVGASDRIRVDAGRAQASPLRGLYMSLFANLPNLILAVIILICAPFSADQLWAGNTVAVVKLIALLIEGMYTGLLAVDVAGAPLNTYSWTFLAIIVPALLASTLSYLAGLKNFRIASIFGMREVNPGKQNPGKPKK